MTQENQTGLKLWTNGADTYIAESAEEARTLYKEAVCEEWVNESDWTEVKKLDKLTIFLDHGQGEVTKTIAEWIAETGKGFLCSTGC